MAQWKFKFLVRLSALTCLLIVAVTAQAASNIDDSGDGLMQSGHQLVEASFDAEQNIVLRDIKLRLSYASTVQPNKLAVTITELGQLETTNHHRLQLVSINQNSTNTGLFNVNAMLSVIVPIQDLAQVYQLAKNKTTSGVKMIVTNVSPYLSVSDKQSARQQLSTQLYGQIRQYLTVLNQMTNKRYQVGRVQFSALTAATQTQLRRPMPTALANAMPANAASANDNLNMQQKFMMNARVLFISK